MSVKERHRADQLAGDATGDDEPERRRSSREWHWRGDDDDDEEEEEEEEGRRLEEDEEEEARSEQAEGMFDGRPFVLEREQGEGQGGESRFEFRRHCEFLASPALPYLPYISLSKAFLSPRLRSSHNIFRAVYIVRRTLSFVR